jgi:hypothetical protein
MRTVPNRREISDIEEINKLQAKPWQIDLLNKNPEYVFWGNYEDGMSSTDKGWGSPQELDSFSQRWGFSTVRFCQAIGLSAPHLWIFRTKKLPQLAPEIKSCPPLSLRKCPLGQMGQVFYKS